MKTEIAEISDVFERFAGAISRNLAPFLYRVTDRTKDWLHIDAANLAVWTPVWLGLGIGVYFGLKTEPAVLTTLLITAASAGVAVLLAQRAKWAAAPVLIAGLGFAAADFRTAWVDAPVLTRDLGIVEVTGRLKALEEGANGRRYVLDIHSIERIEPENLPARARITWRGKAFDAAPGDFITIRAGLGPPPPPVVPGGFDFSRRLYFEKIGAVGFAVTEPEILSEGASTLSDRVKAMIEQWRFDLFKRITAAAPGQGGAIVAAVVTGKREAIEDTSRDALRDAGLAHLLAISGLHMGLATGIVFVAFRSVAALIERFALHYFVKKWAAAAALISGLIYLILSGGGWSARRAFIMTAILFTAVLLDRRALSLRNIAIAASFILITTPEALFHPGFQMSFAAATALVAFFEWWTKRADPDRSFSAIAKFKRYLVGLGATDLIAATATAPFALYHFNRVALYSLPANMAAMPLMGFWVMPAAILALILTPLGLDVWAWRLSALGMDVILSIASNVSSVPGAVGVTKQWPLMALLLLTFGGLWLCVSRAPWRIAGVAAVPAATLLVMMEPSPAVFVAPSGRNAALVAGEDLAPFTARRDRFAVDMWRETVGLDQAEEDAPRLSLKMLHACDEHGCAGPLNDDVTVAIVESEEELAEDCNRADLVVAFVPVASGQWRSCSAALIDRRSVWRQGAHTVFMEDDGAIRIKTDREARGSRPWTPYIIDSGE